MHFLMGGIAIDRDGATGVPGLFAAGEAAAGLHGATRLNSQGLTEGAVFGHRAGLAAAAFADRAGDPEGGVAADADGAAAAESFGIEVWKADDPRIGGWHEALGRLSLPAVNHEGGIAGGGGSLDEDSFVQRLHGLMERGAGIVRGARSTTEALDEWEALARESGGLNKGVADPRRRFRLGAMLALARLLLEAGRVRGESRGAHHRSDQPEMDAAWATHICFSRR